MSDDLDEMTNAELIEVARRARAESAALREENAKLRKALEEIRDGSGRFNDCDSGCPNIAALALGGKEAKK